MKDARLKHIVCIGGGTGTFVALRGLKQYPCHLSAIVAMSDSGGSNKRIRDEFGLLPTSDIRQSFVALADETRGAGLMRKLFMYRFEKGEGISGMTFGNLFMAALSDILGSQQEAIKQTGKVLRIRGTVIPVSYTNTNLFAKYEDGHVVTEEHLIDEPTHDGHLKITQVYLQPQALANPEAVAAIKKADLIVLGPGDLYTSLIPNLLVGGIARAIKDSSGQKVYVMNLMTKYGQTLGFTATDHVRALEKFIGNSLTSVVVNASSLPAEALRTYAKYQEVPVTDNLARAAYYQTIRADLVTDQLVQKPSSDALVRSLIRHDSDKLAKVLVQLVGIQGGSA